MTYNLKQNGVRREWDGSGGEMTNDGGRPHARHLSDLATVNDLDLLGGVPAAAPDLLDGLDHVHALHNLGRVWFGVEKFSWKFFLL